MEIDRTNTPTSYASNTFENNENSYQRAMQEIIRYVKYLNTCVFKLLMINYNSIKKLLSIVY